MLTVLNIAQTPDSPGILFDKDKNVFEISGRSLPENTGKFYEPIIQWLEEYVKAPNSETVVTFKFDYFNSSTAKKIVEMISLLEKIRESSKAAKVIWCYGEGDELIKNRGEELKELSDVPFELVVVSS